MSSMRNAHQRRNHKERAQPAERSRLGLLEKHKDYTLRSKDHNKKKAQLKALKQKAADRNEDEFYFGMLSRSGPSTFASKGKRWTGTVDGDRGNRAMDVETVRLLKTQDMGYLRTQRTLALKEAKALEERVLGLSGTLNPATAVDADADWDEDDDDDDMMMDGVDGIAPPKNKQATAPKPKKIVFADGASEREEMIGLETGKGANDSDDSDDNDISDEDDEKKDPEKLRADQRRRLLEKLQRRLQNARKKLRVLSRAENQLELQRAGMAKTRTVGGIRKSGQKIKVRERKR
ncbi:hypothetical protein SLS62_000904 [Diatrype stigma]|uniref:U3 small nucleolar RNA-associated protein 11 n=1 Tax=Diatrype stigma TaxID=117547 RepID=A0AAN9YS35_9PEZI